MTLSAPKILIVVGGCVALGTLRLALILKSKPQPPDAQAFRAQQILETGIIPRDSVIIEEVTPPTPRKNLSPQETLSEEDLFQQALRIAKEDPQSGFEWSRSLSDHEAQAQFLLFFGLALSDQKALQIKEWIAELPPGKEQRKLLEHLGTAWTKQDPQAALLWASQLRDEALSKRSVQEFMNAWATRDPAMATHYALSQLPEAERIRAIEITLDAWAHQNPKAALEEVQSWHRNDLQSRFGERLFTLQAQNDLSLLSEWLDIQSPSPFRDLGVHVLVAKLSQEDPETAKKWADTIQDRHLKAEALQMLKN